MSDPATGAAPASSRPLPTLPGVEHRYAEVNGIRMHYAVAGDPDADPLVLVHGWPQHWYAWRRLIGPLAERYRVICPDLRGFGWSDAPRGSYLKADLADDVLALADRLELDTFRLAGHDWGGLAGFHLCLRAPDRVTHYAAAGINHLWPQGEPGIGERLALLGRVWYMLLIASPVLGGQLVRRVPTFMRQILVKGAAEPVWSDDELDSFVAQWREPDRARACVSVYRSFLTRELPELARGGFRDEVMHQPAVILCGDADPVIDADDLRGAERNAPNLEVRELAGVGHWVPEEAPERMLEAMRELYER